jgi:hypothetical protein
MTPAQALSTVRYQLNEVTAAFWTDAEIYGYLWEAETILGAELGLFQAYTAHTTTTDTSVYTFPDSTARIENITYDGKKLKAADMRDREYYDGIDYGSTRPTGDPAIYVPWNQNVYLSPVPNDAKTLAFWYYKHAAQITTASTVFSIQDESLQQMLPDYAIWKGSMKDQELNRADRHKQYWDSNVKRAHGIWGDKKYQDRLLVVKDEDDYAGNTLGMD